MPDIAEFEAWIKGQGGQTGLAAKFKRKFGKDIPVSQTVISNWVTRRRVPVGERRDQLEILGWPGPFEWPQEAQEAAAGGPAPYLTREEFAEWRGYWKAGTEEVLKRLEALEDRVRKLDPHGGNS